MLDIMTDEDLVGYVQSLIGERELLLVTRFGSGLYGTETSDSDTDIRVVFLPTAEELLLGEASFTVDSNPDHHKLGKGDLDITCYSLMKFVEMLGDFQISAVEMLYASRGDFGILQKDPVIDWVFQSRHDLISLCDHSPMKLVRRNLGPLVPDYDDNTQLLTTVLNAMSKADPESRLSENIDTLSDLAKDPQISFAARGLDWEKFGDDALAMMLEDTKPPHTSFFFTIRSQKYDTTQRVSAILSLLTKSLRSKQTEKSARPQDDPKSLKEIYQALRILDQIIELASDDQMIFPRAMAPLLRDVRSGNISDEDLKKTAAFYYQNGLEAEKSLPFQEPRSLRTVIDLVSRVHLSVVEKRR